LRQYLQDEKQPRFDESVDVVEFTFGGMDVGFQARIGELRKRNGKSSLGPIHNINPAFYAIRNRLYVDTKIYEDSEFSVFIKKNRLIGKPPSWDMNSNQFGMEVVDSQNRVRFQLFYRTKSNVIVRGVFIIGKESCTIDATGIHPGAARYAIERMFKYPSTLYPGQLVETF